MTSASHARSTSSEFDERYTVRGMLVCSLICQSKTCDNSDHARAAFLLITAVRCLFPPRYLHPQGPVVLDHDDFIPMTMTGNCRPHAAHAVTQLRPQTEVEHRKGTA